MNDETISKVLTGETDISKMSRDDFVEMLKCLGRMYFCRVMNCVDGTGKSDKEWTALSCIFSRVVEAITEKPSGNAAAMREALEPWIALAEWLLENAGKDGLGKAIQENGPIIRQRLEELRGALAAPPRNCDVYTANELKVKFNCELVSELPIANEHEKNLVTITAMGVIDTLFATTQEGGAM